MSKSSQAGQGWEPFRLDRALTRIVTAAANGHDYRVSLSIPDTPPPVAGFPVLVVLDGPALFATLAETERRLTRRPQATGVTPTVIVGVGHAGAGTHDEAQRYRDFTPGPAVDDDAANRHETGGADRFLDFILDQMLPMVAEQAPVDSSRRALMGHSLGGYLALHALTTRPGAFAAFGAVSPSIWWDPDRLSRRARELKPDSARLMLTVGDRERADATADPRRAARRMVDAVRDLGLVMESSLGPRNVQVSVLPDEDHASIVSAASVRMLRLVG